VGHNEQINGSCVLIFVEICKTYQSTFFVIQWNVLLMYHEFSYKSQNQSLLVALGDWLEENKTRKIKCET